MNYPYDYACTRIDIMRYEVIDNIIVFTRYTVFEDGFLKICGDITKLISIFLLQPGFNFSENNWRAIFNW